MDNPVSKNATLFITTLSSFLTTFMVSSVNIALPAISQTFPVSAQELGWVATAYLLSAAAFLVPFGRLADIYGRKKIFLIGIAGYGLASLVAGLSANVLTLILSRGFQGAAGAMVFATAIAILSSVFPPQERGKALGINLAATYTGLSLGPFLGGVLTQQFGWRSIFVFNLLFSLVIIPLVFRKLRGEWAESRGEAFDWKGSLVYMTGLLGIMYGFTLFPDPEGVLLLAGGLVVMGLFFRLEKRISSPVLDLSHLRKNVVFIFSSLAAFINYSATFATGFLLSLYLQYIKGMTPQEAGIILIAQPVTMTLFSPLAGRLSDKVEPRIVASAGMALTAAGLVPLIFLGHDTTKLSIILTLVLIGTGFALFSSPNTNAIMSSVEKRFYGIASATVGTMRLTGQAISMGTAMLIFTLIIGRGKITPALYPGFLESTHTAFLVFTLLCTAGIFASLARGRLR